MAWRECKGCHKKIFHVPGRALSHEGYCRDCFEQVTGKCAECGESGTLKRAHLGTLECSRCQGTGRARSNPARQNP